jgi:hypothetical protein
MLLIRHYKVKLVLDASYKAMRSYFNYMSEILTIDLNGESIIE